MKTSTTAWTAAIVVMSVQGPFAAAEAAPAQNLQQEAEPERPKYYFPRHVKRAYPNVTSSSKTTLSSLLAALTDNDPNTNLFNPRPSTDSTTTDGQTDVLSQLTSSITEPASVPADASGTTPKPSNSTSTEPTTTGGLLDLGSLFGPTSSDDVKTKISEQPNTTDATTTEPAGQPSANNTITTVTLDEPAYSPTSTTANGGGLLGSGGLLGPILQPSRTSSSIVQPTYVSEDSAPNGTELDPQPAASGSGGAPYNEVSPTAPASTEAALSGPTNTSTGPVLVGLSTVIDNAAPTTTSESGGLLDPLLSALKPEPTPTSSTYAQGTGSDGTAPVIVQPTGSSVPNTTTKDSPGLLDPLLSGLKSEPTPTGSTYAQGTGSEGTAPVIVQPTGSSVPNATITDSPGLLDSLLSPTPTDSSIGSVVSSMSSQVSSVSSTDALSGLASTLSSQLSSIVATNPAVSSSLSSEFSGILSSAASSLVSSSASNTATIIGTGISTGSYSLSTSGASVVPIPVGTVSSTIPSNATVTASSESTATPTSGLTTYASASTSSSSLVMPSISVPGNSSSTLTATGLVPTITSSTLSLPSYESSSSTSTASSVSSTSEPIPTSSSAIATTSAPSTTSTSQPPASLVPTGTDTATTMSIPSSIIFAPTSTSTAATLTSVESGSTTSSTHTGMPSAMPRLVQPPGGMPKSPANTTLIQVGFNYGLNFPFVVSTDNSASQIFTYLPKGIAYALGISNDKVVMNALMPYDTTKSLNFITTLAQAYIPSDMVSQLQLDLHTQMSKAYSNPDDAVHTLMSMINPTIPILPGANMDQGYGTPSENPAATAPGSGGDGAPIGGDSGSSQAVNGTSVGIGLGAVAGAAVYAAAMVYVARRYRKKRASHKRASSVQGTSDMAQRSPAALSGGMGGYFMSGANGARGGPSRQSSYGSGGRDSRQSDGSSNNRSVREQGISAPISHGNSLGWD